MRHQVEAIADELPSMEEPPKVIGGEVCDRGLFESEIAEKLPTSVIYETACNITRQNFGDKLRLYDQCKLKI